MFKPRNELSAQVWRLTPVHGNRKLVQWNLRCCIYHGLQVSCQLKKEDNLTNQIVHR